MHLRIAGWTIALRADPPDLRARLAARYAAFTVEPGPVDLTVEVEALPAEEGTSGAVNSVSLLQAGLSRKGEDYLLDRPGVYGMIAPSVGRAALRIRSDDAARHAAREAEYFFRSALALFALPRDGLLIHGAALKRTDSVYLFVGQSGSGKSTVVALSQEANRATALGDDLILIRRQFDAWHAYGTPFWNFDTRLRDGQHEHGPVAHIYKLIQDRTVFAEPLGGAAATAELVANCPIVNDQPDLLPAVIGQCAAFASRVGVARLHFRKDVSFWNVVE